MHALRTSLVLARLTLAWFVLTLSIAGASPFVHPKAMEIVCSAGGAMKIVMLGDEGPAAETSQHTLDCSLCLVPTLPIPKAQTSVSMPQPLAHALTPIVAAHIAALVGAPLPPRGPPFLI